MIEDASYIRLKDIRIGYTFPKNVISKTFIKNARLFVSASNLLTLTNYPGLDPEPFGGRSAFRSGTQDYQAYPMAKTYTFGISLNF